MSESVLLYIHGFGSSGKSGKAEIFRNFFANQIIAPSLSPIPELAIDTLEQIADSVCQCGRRIVFAGSSLGGYYATYLAHKYESRAVLINPAVKPYLTLASRIGLNHSYYDFSDYEFTQTHINHLRHYDVAEPQTDRYMLLLQTGDTVLDYREAAEKFGGAKIDIEEGGSHGYEGVERKMESIKDFLKL